MYNFQIYITQFSFDEILSRAIFLKNVMYGSKTLSSIELAKGYTTALAGLPKQSVTDDLGRAHVEQVARRALHRMVSSRDVRTLERNSLTLKTPIYYFERQKKFGVWQLGFVLEAKENLVLVIKNSSGRGHH